MIYKLDGMLETVDFGGGLFLIYHNDEATDYPKHWHSAAEIIMPIKGGYEVTVNETLYPLAEYDVLIIPTGDIHEIHVPKTIGAGERIILQFDISLLKSVKGLTSASYLFFKPRKITPAEHPELHPIIKESLLAALDEYRGKADYYEANVAAKLINIAVAMARNYQSHGENPEDFADLPILVKRKAHIANFNRCIEYINQHYKEDMPLELISGIAGFSKFHFTRWFKQFAGVSFYDYLTRVRVKVAESMLINSDAAITEIALESGFQSIATFNRVFKHNKQLTPTEFRLLNNV
ncbi:MAG: AraC family transcriptional regulator [Oscillospiraceae bacterium]|nr:AraC family transcriptional regulator [Oscillospiraceae bacterium]